VESKVFYSGLPICPSAMLTENRALLYWGQMYVSRTTYDSITHAAEDEIGDIMGTLDILVLPEPVRIFHATGGPA